VNKKLALSVALNVLLGGALSVLLYLVYPQFTYQLDSVEYRGRYNVRTYRNYGTGAAYFEVLLGPEEWDRQPQVPRRIYSRSGTQAFFITAFGADVTGNGVPDLVVQQWNGSASEFGSRYLVLELDGSAVKEVAMIEGLAAVKCEDLNEDGIREITGGDEAYCFWGGYSRASSPCPAVVLSFDKTQARFVLDRKLMAKPPLSQEQLGRLSLEYKNECWGAEGDLPPARLFNTMFDLIYSGNERQAWELCDACWLQGSPFSEEKWKEEVRDALRHSPFNPAIAHGNKEGS